MGESERDYDMNVDGEGEEDASTTGSEAHTTGNAGGNIGRGAQDTKRSAPHQSQQISPRMRQRQRIDKAAHIAAKHLAPHSEQRASSRLEQCQRVDFTPQLYDLEGSEEMDMNHFVSTLIQQNNNDVYMPYGSHGGGGGNRCRRAIYNKGSLEWVGCRAVAGGYGEGNDRAMAEGDVW
ncbi:unnamed protein product [Choristocarpus tenellus]